MNSRFHNFHMKGLARTNSYKTAIAVKHKNIQMKGHYTMLCEQHKHMIWRHGYKCQVQPTIRKYHTYIYS